MGAQDNLTNVLAVVLGVAIGSSRADLVALAGLAAGVAEAISMGGVLYTSTRADLDLDARARAEAPGSAAAAGPGRRRLSPVQAGAVCFGAAMVAGLVPLIPFALLPLNAAVVTCFGISILALFGVGSWAGGVTGRTPWRDGLRLVAIAGTAALAAACVGVILRVD